MPFQIEIQEHGQWCWAAVTASVDRYFSPHSVSTQCSIASMVLGLDCCGAPGPCNTQAFLQDALDAVGKLRDCVSGPLSFADTLHEIEQGFPVGVRIGWSGGAAHFVIIRGCSESAGAQLLDIADPLYVDSIQHFDVFATDYLGCGEWTDTFLLTSA
jgi:hypothetical protein